MSQKQTTRLYHVSDSKVIARAVFFLGQFNIDKVQFEDQSPRVFVEDFGQILSDLIEVGYTMPDDAMIVKEQARLTQVFTDTITEIFEQHKKIDYYAQLAFDKDSSILAQVETKVLSSVKSQYDTIIRKAQSIANVILASKAQLIAAGCKESLITTFVALAKKLSTSREEQEAYIAKRTQLKNKRINHFNEFYVMMTELHKSSRLIWPNNPELYSRYDLPYSAPTEKTPDPLKAEIEEMTQSSPMA